jgi:hypothetical protein
MATNTLKILRAYIHRQTNAGNDNEVKGLKAQIELLIKQNAELMELVKAHYFGVQLCEV